MSGRLVNWADRFRAALLVVGWATATLVVWSVLVPWLNVWGLGKAEAIATLDIATTVAAAGAAILAVIDFTQSAADRQLRPNFTIALQIEYPPTESGTQANTGMVAAGSSVGPVTLRIPDDAAPVIYLELTNTGNLAARFTSIRTDARVHTMQPGPNRGHDILTPTTPTTWLSSTPTEDAHIAALQAGPGDILPVGWSTRTLGLQCKTLTPTDLPYQVELRAMVIADGMTSAIAFDRTIVFVQGPPYALPKFR